jgi:membrane protein required for beta-lactamase induction
MADLSTYARAKDWIIVALVGVVFSLLGVVASENRRMILANSQSIENHAGRLVRLEETVNNQREELSRRLVRIEDKLDRISAGRYESSREREGR